MSPSPVDDTHRRPSRHPRNEEEEEPASRSADLLSPFAKRPESQRSVTEPMPSVLTQSFYSTPRPSSSHRNRSPYSRTHLRSRSTGAALSAPAMTRAHSSPAAQSTTTTTVPYSSKPSTEVLANFSLGGTLRSPTRQRSPLRPSEESTIHTQPQRSPGWFDGNGNAIESIQEDSELSLTPRAPVLGPSSHLHIAPFSRSASLRRRPASPLHNVTNASAMSSSSTQSVDNTTAAFTTSVGSSASSSPALGPQRFNEAFPALHHYASSSSFSSIPSTPTSQRSRSPSISSLDTIEDVPDLESEAIEADRLEKLALAAEKAERSDRGEDELESLPRRRGSFESGGRVFGLSRAASREKKRWSVCGGERRVDLDLDTIWED